MKRTRLLLLLVLLMTAATGAWADEWPGMLTLPAASENGTVTLEGVTSNTIIDENFDDYTAGGYLAQTANAAGNSYWTTWSNAPGTDEDGTLATLNDNTCLKVNKDNDQVLLLGDKTSGMWEYSLDVYVPEGKFGYFNLLHDFAGDDSTWAFQCFFNALYDYDSETYYYSPGHGTVHAGSANTADLPCVVNEWMHVSIVIDIDKDLAKLYFNGDFICEWQWSLDCYGEDVVSGKLAVCNFFGEGDEYYVDNIKFTQISDLPAGFERDGYGNIYVESGTQINLVTTPAENYHLASLSDGTNTYDVDDDGKVTITMPDADLTLTAEFAENTYDVSLNKTGLDEGEPALWKAKSTNVAEVNLGEADLKGVKKGQTVTVTYSGDRKVIGVKAEKKGGAAGKPVSEITSEDIFKVIASDGIIYDNIAAAESAGTVAQGLIVYVGSNTGNENYKHGLALALNDENNNTQGEAINACNAKNTSTPIVDALWILPSKDQWNTMFNAAGGDWKLRDCFSSAGGNNMVKDGEYWSSSGDSEWVIYFMFSGHDWAGTWGDIQPYYNYVCNVRACIVF